MEKVRVIVFDIWGEFAHFRRFFTTSSPLTFSFPPPTTLRGIIGAILGFSKEEYIVKTRRLSFGIKLLSPVKKLRLGVNFIFTKGSGEKFEPTLFHDKKGDAGKTLRTQVPVEFLKEPVYRIFVSGEDNLLNSLLKYLPYHKTEYTLSLGLSECLADFKFVGEFEAEWFSESPFMDTAILVKDVKSLEFSSGKRTGLRIGKERIPLFMDENRQVLAYEDVIFEVSGKRIAGKFKNIFYLAGLDCYVSFLDYDKIFKNGASFTP